MTTQRAMHLLASLVVLGLVGACSGARSNPKPASPANRPAVGTPGPGEAPTLTGPGDGHLAAGSHPEVLPGPVLIADEGNDRLLIVDPQGRVAWTFPQPGDLPAGVEFKAPDDAFFTPDGRQIIASEEEYSVVSLIDIASRKIVWRYGTPGSPGAGPDHLSNPDDAIVLPNGAILTADIKNGGALLPSHRRRSAKAAFQVRPAGWRPFSEDLMGEKGFSAAPSLLYHLHAPTAIVAAEAVAESAACLVDNHPLLPVGAGNSSGLVDLGLALGCAA